jgi:N-acetyl-gamma-glutamyl-phosphate reductase
VEALTDASEADEFSFDPQAFNETNRISLRVLPHQSGHVLLMARLDNLGKGAAGVGDSKLESYARHAGRDGIASLSKVCREHPSVPNFLVV